MSKLEELLNQLREEVKSYYGTKECPANDWFCKFFENGVCKLKDAETKCSHMGNRDARKNQTFME